MGFSQDYPDIPDWVAKPEGYQEGARVKYQGNIFYANFWASEPGVGDPSNNGWRHDDELYDQTSSPATEPPKIIAYIPTWRKKGGFNYANVEMYRSITHGIIAFLMFDEFNLGQFVPKSIYDVETILPDVVNTGHQNGARILIALGGATDYGFLKLMTEIGNNATHPLLDQAVQRVVNFVQTHALDGVDLDLECWWGKPGEPDQGGRPKSAGPHAAGYALTLFAQKLKQAMPRKLVSAAVFGTSWYGNNYDPQIANYVDWLGIMTYDLTGSWNNSPVGPHTALHKIRNMSGYAAEQQGAWPPARSGGTDSNPMVDNPILSVEDTLWYWTNPLFVNWQGAGQKIPRNKIAAGVPIYGYDFAYPKGPDDETREVPPGYKVIPYSAILTQFSGADTNPNGNIKVAGNTSTPPFISPPGTYPFAHNIYFETPNMAVAKLNFLRSVGAQGVIIWEVSNDDWKTDRSIIKALYQNSGNPAIKPPITAPPQARYWIVNRKSGMAITAPSNPGEQVYQAPLDVNNPAQVFWIEKSRIKCASSSLVLDVKQNSGEDQTPIIVWTEGDDTIVWDDENNSPLGQKFRLFPTTADYYLIRPRPDDANEERFRLAVAGGSTQADAPIVQDAWWGQGSTPWEDNQQWQFRKVINNQSHFTPHNWMSQIWDDKLLSELNIPGTHETCALHGGAAAVCQTMSLQEQLESGIRFLDIRCRQVGDGFTIHHGPFFQHLTFGTGVLDVCIDFLTKNPTECIVMSIKDEYTPDNAKGTFEETLNSYIENTKGFWYLNEEIPALGSVRRKIVLFRRYGGGSQGIVANPHAWGKNATFNIPHSNGNLMIQDEYYVPTLFALDAKWSSVEALLRATDGRKTDWYINFLSGTGGAYPINIAKDRIANSYPMNPRLFDFLQWQFPRRFGTLMMDFPDYPLIATIISLNPDIRPVGR